MRDSYRPILRLALFGTYTLIAVGIDVVRTRIREARTPAELRSRPNPVPRPRRR